MATIFNRVPVREKLAVRLISRIKSWFIKVQEQEDQVDCVCGACDVCFDRWEQKQF